MRGYVDLHCHCIPGVDDGASTVEEAVRLCRGLFRLGCDIVVATPHIRTAMFDNTRSSLMLAYERFLETTADVPGMPETALAAEYFCDDVFWSLFEAGDAMLYPGGKAALIEFPPEQIPLNVEKRFFEMNVRGVRPVLAHPERCVSLFANTKPLEPMLEIGVLATLDLTSLVGRHGSGPRRAAERMLDEGVYFSASTDSHHPADLELAERAIERLRALVGREEAYALLAENPSRLIERAPG